MLRPDYSRVMGNWEVIQRDVDRAVASGLQTIRALLALNLRRDVDKIMQAGKRFMSLPAAVRDTDGDEEASEAISFETTKHWVQR